VKPCTRAPLLETRKPSSFTPNIPARVYARDPWSEMTKKPPPSIARSRLLFVNEIVP
jgi:hypothetical protein